MAEPGTVAGRGRDGRLQLVLLLELAISCAQLMLGEALRWPELPPLTASNFLPPAEVIGWEAMMQRRQRAAAAAAREEDDRGSAADAHDAEADAALHERMRPAIEELRARLELRGRR